MAKKKNSVKKTKNTTKRNRRRFSNAEVRAYWVGYGEGSNYNSEFNHHPGYENPKLVAAAKAGFEKGKYDFFNTDDPTKNYDVFGLFGKRLRPRKKDIK